MRYFSMNEMDHDGKPIVSTVSEEEIRRDYWPYWQQKMIVQYGEEEFNKTWSFEECLEDWCVIHWAWEVTE